MASKLGIYKESLGHLEERTITSLSEDREPRRVLDDYYDGVLAYCLEKGYWNFAMRAVQVDTSTSISPTFGYDYAFQKPSDWVRTYWVSTDESMDTPLNEYKDENGLWFANFDPLYIKYVSSDSAYGGDLSIWPQSFADFVAFRLARMACKRVTGASSLLTELKRDEKKALANAASKDAMNEAPGFAPVGTWARSRGGDNRNLSRWGRS
jgi:hypothetical protein